MYLRKENSCKESKWCLNCERNYRNIKGHERKGCLVRKHIISYKECKNYRRKISLSNLKRHERVCESDYKIRRNNLKK